MGIQTGLVDTGDSAGALEYKQAPVIRLDRELRPQTIENARGLICKSGIDERVQRQVLSSLPR